MSPSWPPLLPPEYTETMWLNLEPEAVPLWDFSMCADTSRTSEAPILLKK